MKWWEGYYKNKDQAPEPETPKKKAPAPELPYKMKRAQLLKEIEEHRSGRNNGITIRAIRASKSPVMYAVHFEMFEQADCKRKSLYGVLTTTDPSIVTCKMCLKRMSFRKEIKENKNE